MITPGSRVKWTAQILDPGQYAQDADGNWHGCTPTGMMCNLSAHSWIQHEDGSISVAPSILVTQNHADGPRRWHGYLERGIWREVP